MEDLIKIANEYVKQDNMMTAYPIGIAVEEIKYVLSNDDADRVTIYTNRDYYQLETSEEVLQLYLDVIDDDMDALTSKCKYIDTEDLVEVAEELFDSNNVFREVREYQANGNIFLTMSGYKNHIEQNGHNLKEARPYLIHLFRNDEMRVLAEHLMDIATLPKEEWCEAALRYYKRWKEVK